MLCIAICFSWRISALGTLSRDCRQLMGHQLVLRRYKVLLTDDSGLRRHFGIGLIQPHLFKVGGGGAAY